MASRVVPPTDGDELPPPPAAPKTRVYGRATPAEPGTASAPRSGPAVSTPAPTSGAQETERPPAPFDGQRESPFGEPHQPREAQPSGSRPHPSWGPQAPAPVIPDADPRDAGPWDGASLKDAGFGAPEQRTASPQSPAGPPGPARASASVRVPPANGRSFAPGSAAAPPMHGPDGLPFSEHTTDLAGRGRGGRPRRSTSTPPTWPGVVTQPISRTSLRPPCRACPRRGRPPVGAPTASLPRVRNTAVRRAGRRSPRRA